MNIFKERNIPYIIYILITIYFAQGALYSNDSVISQLALFIFLFISLYYFFKTILLKNKQPFYNVWTAFLLLNVLGYILSDFYRFSMFKGILINFLPFYPFYYFANKGKLQSTSLRTFLFIFLPLIVINFFYKKNQILNSFDKENLDVVNNVAYSFVFLMPYLFLFKRKKILSYILMILFMFFIIQGAKRGAILVGLICLVFFMHYQLKLIDKRNRIKGYIITFLASLLMLGLGVKFYLENEFLASRMEDLESGGLSGRDRIYSNIFNAWYESESIFNVLFGYGFAGSTLISGGGYYAHNDWLELLSNFGILGVIMYLIFFIYMFKAAFHKDLAIDKKKLLLTISILWLIITFFSMGYTSGSGYLFAIILGYLIGDKSKGIN